MKKPIKILIVDDEQIVVEGIKKGLESTGWEVHTILGGKEAIELLSKTYFDVVILDLVMPGMNGVQACRGIKKVSPNTEVLLLSGVPAEIERLLVPFLDAGGRDFILRKPLFSGEVALAVRRLLGEKLGL